MESLHFKNPWFLKFVLMGYYLANVMHRTVYYVLPVEKANTFVGNLLSAGVRLFLGFLTKYLWLKKIIFNPCSLSLRLRLSFFKKILSYTANSIMKGKIIFRYGQKGI